MSDTPRTDAFSKVPSDPQETWAIARDWAAFARELERELAEAVRVDGARIKQYADALDARRCPDCGKTVTRKPNGIVVIDS